MIKAHIDVTKIDKNRLFVGKERANGTRGKFLSVVLVENRNGNDKLGNVGFVRQEATREETAAGSNGVILGNWRRLLATVKAIKEEDAIAPSKSGSNWSF